MLDRIAGRRGSLAVSLPGQTNNVNIKVVSLFGLVELNATATKVGSYTYYHDYGASTFTSEGQRTVIWSDVTTGEELASEDFYVGPSHVGETPVYSVLSEALRRTGEAYQSRLLIAEEDMIGDPELIGSDGDYSGYYLMLHPLDASPANVGEIRRVHAFNGEAITLSSPFPEAPSAGARYGLFERSPRSAWDIVDFIVNELWDLVLPKASALTTIFVDDGQRHAAVPEPLRYVTKVFDSDDDELAWESWRLAPDRQIYIDDDSLDAGDSIRIYGHRKFTRPVWWDSYFTGDTSGILAKITMLLHAHEARGEPLDPEEHLRRQLAAMEEYDRFRRSSHGRLDNGSVEVIE